MASRTHNTSQGLVTQHRDISLLMYIQHKPGDTRIMMSVTELPEVLNNSTVIWVSRSQKWSLVTPTGQTTELTDAHRAQGRLVIPDLP